jgi:DNA-binding MarR family transcriptional regulator
VINLSKKYEAILAGISPELLLPYTELGILQTLKIEKRAMYASEIASELDRSYQLVGKRGKMLAQRGLVDRDENDEGRRIFKITPLANQSYFSDKDIVELELRPETTKPST